MHYKQTNKPWRLKKKKKSKRFDNIIECTVVYTERQYNISCLTLKKILLGGKITIRTHFLVQLIVMMYAR